jgi:hypothetical protein
MRSSCSDTFQRKVLRKLHYRANVAWRTYEQHRRVRSLQDERDRNLADVKAFDKRFRKCFSTPAGKKQFGTAVSLVRAGFKEMASAKWSIWEAWVALGEANTGRAEEQVRNTLVDVIAAEPTFDQGMVRLGRLD